MAETISFNDFKKAELKVAKILSVEDILGKDKLFKLSIDVGEENPRTLIAGVKESYSKEELVGKQIIVVANLERKRIGSLVSEGMLLAVKASDASYALLTIEKEAAAGTLVE
ncbi:MAG TPA: hypothetical protein HA222_00680 [Candidatus Diapherotrites archaeon]|uniref:Methionine--tRNA ligase n=1 Tax=Candidatus Iainarchaeum sp. TaxID=3101447 RepID=A0A7J4JUM7_9ARCH|nr:hypothetical protein [Candidatus Diapherotrites archaeon]